MSTAASETVAPGTRQDFGRALEYAAAIFFGAFALLRPCAGQFTPYATDQALAAVQGLAFVLSALAAGYFSRRTRAEFPGGVAWMLALWLILLFAGVLHSPNPGAALPQFSDSATHALMLYALYHFCAGRGERVRMLLAVLAAAGAVEGAVGLWQYFVDLPQLLEKVQSGAVELKDELSSQLGLERIHSTRIYGTFAISNSYAAFLLLSTFATLACFPPKAAGSGKWALRLVVWVLALGLQGAALVLSGSKGVVVSMGLAVLVLGADYLPQKPAMRFAARALVWLCAIAIVVALIGGVFNWINRDKFGLSMTYRFYYWEAALNTFREQPLVGIGLSGFEDAICQNKPALGTWTRHAHNDWLEFLCELGPLGPLMWGTLWWLVTRRRTLTGTNQSVVPATAGSVESTTGGAAAGTLLKFILLGGAFAFLVSWMTLGSLNGTDIRDLFSGEKPSALGLLAALSFLVIFLLTCVGLGTGAAPSGEGSQRWMSAALRAGIAGILIHQLVDFDFSAPGVMGPLFCCGGLLLALQAQPATHSSSPSKKNSFMSWALPVFALLLAVPAIFSPLMSGVARSNAEIDEENMHTLIANADQTKTGSAERRTAHEEILSTATALVRGREDACRYAPFDAQARLDLARAYEIYAQLGSGVWPDYHKGGTPTPPEDLATQACQDAVALRPRWPLPHYLIGMQYLMRGARELSEENLTRARQDLKLATAALNAAATRYPLAPLFKLLEGDAFLLSGDNAHAVDRYNEAWSIDGRIFDGNVRFASLFHDPRPGGIPRYLLEPQILEALHTRGFLESASLDQKAQYEFARALRVVISWGSRMRYGPDAANTDPAKREALQKGLLAAAQRLHAVAPEDPHADFFAVAALALLKGPKDPVVQQAWNDLEARRQAAREVGRPVTPIEALAEVRWSLGH